MSKLAKNLGLFLAAPLLSLGLLAGIAAEKQTHLTPADAEPYHTQAREAIEEVPYRIGSWMGMDEHVAESAVQLLRPNKILSRRYVDTRPGTRRSVGLLVVQTRDTRDMLGHYPPVCYVAHGETQIVAVPRDWQVGDMIVEGMEYVFEKQAGGQRYQRVVYNFMVVPGTGIVRDMDGLRAAAKDYQLRYFGAAQFQLVMLGEMPREERDEVFATLIGANTRVIKTLMSGDVQ